MPVSHLPDDALLRLARTTGRDGERAFAQLWKRHRVVGLSVARALAPDGAADPEDVVSEAYARILGTLRRGSGPESEFRPYLYAVIRSIVFRSGRVREVATDSLEDLPGTHLPDRSDESLESITLARAFASLPADSRRILWLTEVEEASPAELSERLGIAPNSVASRSYRAREALRKAWVREHATASERRPPECRAALRVMHRSLFGTSLTDSRTVAHLETCDSCPQSFAEMKRALQRLSVLLIVVFLGPRAVEALDQVEPAGTHAAPAPAQVIGGALRLAGGFRRAAPLVGVAAVVVAVALVTVSASSSAATSEARPTRLGGTTGTPSPDPTPVEEAPTPAPEPRPTALPAREVALAVNTHIELATPPPAPPAPFALGGVSIEPSSQHITASGTSGDIGATVTIWGSPDPGAEPGYPGAIQIASTTVQPDGTWATGLFGGFTPVTANAWAIQTDLAGVDSDAIVLFQNASFYPGVSATAATVVGMSASWELTGWPGGAWAVRRNNMPAILASGTFGPSGTAIATVSLAGGTSGTTRTFQFGYVDGPIMQPSGTLITALVP